MNSKITQPWRTVIVERADQLTLNENCLCMHVEERDVSIPLEQIRTILISSSRGSISLPLLNRLISQNTAIIVCDESHTPIGKIHGINTHFESAGRHMDQAAWTERRKNAIWKQIVEMKIARQADLLGHIYGVIPSELSELKNSVKSGDATNREAVAAKIYFRILFGPEFIRFESDDINRALNYGYTILSSAFSRAIALSGYSSALGIHHCSRVNPNNLANDLMEPFRPFVDWVVFQNMGRNFDWDYKTELISLLYKECIYDNKQTEIGNAIEQYVSDVLKCMSIPRASIKEIQFGKAFGSDIDIL